MSKRTTSLSVTKVNDLVLGAFAHVPRNEQLDHAIRYFSTWSGSECVLSILRQLLALTRTSLPHAVSYSWYGIDAKSWGRAPILTVLAAQIIQYGAKVLVPLIELRARTKLRAGLKVDAAQDAKAIGALRAFSSGIGDARMLWRIWGKSRPRIVSGHPADSASPAQGCFRSSSGLSRSRSRSRRRVNCSPLSGCKAGACSRTTHSSTSTTLPATSCCRGSSLAARSTRSVFGAPGSGRPTCEFCVS